MIQAIVTDIEGTTSSLSFVKDVLFPYARANMPDFVRRHRQDDQVRALLQEVGAIVGRELDDDEAVAELIRWIDEDRKLGPLKALQGLIWEAGYRDGRFLGHVYSDAYRKLSEWHASGRRLYVYSSGSEHAQKLLFAHTEYGDLTPLFSGYFDTRIGAKQEADSYRQISANIGLQPSSILFLSDIAGELDAARSAGLQTCQLIRDGAVGSADHPQAADFSSIILSD